MYIEYNYMYMSIIKILKTDMKYINEFDSRI